MAATYGSEISINTETAKIYERLLESRHLDLLTSNTAISVTLMDSSEALTPKKKAGIVNSRKEIRDSSKIHAIAFFFSQK